jgi:Uma2 family endonuclease
MLSDKKKKYTADDYRLLEEGAPFQLINNELIMSPSPFMIHQLILGEFYDELKSFVKKQENPGLVVLPPMDINFDSGNIYQPDLVYISKERIVEIVKDRIEGAPDLVLEILSPSTAYYDLRRKKIFMKNMALKNTSSSTR